MACSSLGTMNCSRHNSTPRERGMSIDSLPSAWKTIGEHLAFQASAVAIPFGIGAAAGLARLVAGLSTATKVKAGAMATAVVAGCVDWTRHYPDASVPDGEDVDEPSVYFNGGYARNCRLSYAASTLTITGAAAALSATNKCVIGMSNNSGAPAAFEITADVNTTFGAGSDTARNLFGITDANWANAMPMYLYYCDGDSADYFGFTRQPNRIETGNAETDICQKGETDCEAQTDMLLMTSGLTLRNEVNRPCVAVGSFEATYATAGGAWAVGALVAGGDGFGLFQEGQTFTMPPGQNVAANGTYLIDNVGTAPVFTTNNYLYTISRCGDCSTFIYLEGDGGTDGAGAVATLLALPYADTLSFGIPLGVAKVLSAAGGGAGGVTDIVWSGAGTAHVSFREQAPLTADAENGDFSNGDRKIITSFTYKAF